MQSCFNWTWKYNKLLHLLFTGFPSSKFRKLHSKMNTRIRHVYTEKTWKTYHRMFLIFLSFCHCLQVDVSCIEVVRVTLFMEYLCQNSISVAVIRNYIAGITVYFKWLGLNHAVFAHFRISMMFKALEKSVHKNPYIEGYLK